MVQTTVFESLGDLKYLSLVLLYKKAAFFSPVLSALDVMMSQPKRMKHITKQATIILLSKMEKSKGQNKNHTYTYLTY